LIYRHNPIEDKESYNEFLENATKEIAKNRALLAMELRAAGLILTSL
jgi:hypothetical protein